MKKILYIGHFTDASGYANTSRGYLRILDKYLDKSEYELKILNIPVEKRDFSEGIDTELIKKYSLNNNILSYIDNNKYIIFYHLLPDAHLVDSEQYPVFKILKNKNRIKTISFVCWETDTIPERWKNIYNKNIFNEISVLCDWNKEIFERETGIKTYTIPAYLEVENIENKIKSDKFTIFSMSQWHHRKGFDILIKAYCQEFFEQSDVELIIKTYRGETSRNGNEEIEKQAIINDILNYKSKCTHYGKQSQAKISLKTGYCTKKEIKEIYEKTDVFCLTTRGEAFGLTIAEALLYGIPCIVPDKGGHLDYMDKDNNYFIKSFWEPAYNLPFDVYSSKDMNYIESSILDTRKKMRQAYNDWKSGTLKDKQKQNKKFTGDFLSDEKIFSKLFNILKN